MAASFSAFSRARVEQLVGWDHLGHQPGLERGVRIEVGVVERQLERLRRADHARQEVGHAAVGRRPDAPVGDCQEGILGGDPDVGGERQRHAGPRGRAVDRRDHRIGNAADVDDGVVESLGAAADLRGQVDVLVRHAALEPVDVAAGAEGAPGAGHDQRPDRGAVGEPGGGGGQLADQLRAHRVQCVRAVQRQGPDLAVDLDLERLELGRLAGQQGNLGLCGF